MVEYNVSSYTGSQTPSKLAPNILPVSFFHYSFSCSLNKYQGKACLSSLFGPDCYTIFSRQHIFSPNLHMHQANKPNKQRHMGHQEVGELFLRSNAL